MSADELIDDCPEWMLYRTVYDCAADISSKKSRRCWPLSAANYPHGCEFSWDSDDPEYSEDEEGEAA